MRVTVRQAIAAPRPAVEEAFLDPGFYRSLGKMPNLAPAEVLEQVEDGDLVRMRVQYAFNGTISPAVRRVLDPAKLTWVQESVVSRSDHVTEFRMIPDHYADRLRFGGSYRFENDDGATEQMMEGDLVVRYPIVGPVVERAIATGIRQHLAEEARLLEEWVSAGG